MFPFFPFPYRPYRPYRPVRQDITQTQDINNQGNGNVTASQTASNVLGGWVW